MAYRIIIIGFFVASLLSLSAHAVGVSGQAGTLGLGVTLDQRIKDQLNTRLAVNYFTYSTKLTKDEVDYDATANLSSLAVLLDWHPWKGVFMLTGGILINQSELTVDAKAQGQYNIGNEIYRGQAKVNGTVSFRPLAPYLAMGWGSAPRKTQGLTWGVELGLVFQGKPSIDLKGGGSACRQSNQTSTTPCDPNIAANSIDLSNDAVFQQNLATEEQNLEKDFEDFNIFPVLGFMLGYRF